MTQSRWAPVSSQEHQRQTTQPCQRACFPFTWRTPFSLSKVWCIQARADLCNDWSKKKKGVIQTACRLLVTWKTSLSKSVLLPLQVFKGTDTLFKVTSGFFFFFRWSDLKKNSPERKRVPTEKSGGQWRGRRQRYHSAKESMTVAATVYLGRGKREWRVAKGGAGWKRGTDWLAVSWGACLPAGKGHGREQE